MILRDLKITMEGFEISNVLYYSKIISVSKSVISFKTMTWKKIFSYIFLTSMLFPILNLNLIIQTKNFGLPNSLLIDKKILSANKNILSSTSEFIDEFESSKSPGYNLFKIFVN